MDSFWECCRPPTSLRAGLSSAAWVTVDDTGARHKAANGFCTQIGNAHFVWFGTTASKSPVGAARSAPHRVLPRPVPRWRAPGDSDLAFDLPGATSVR